MRIGKQRTAAAAYGVAAFFALVGVFTLVRSAGYSLGGHLGVDPRLPQLFLAAAVAICVPPIHRRISRRLRESIVGIEDVLGRAFSDLLQPIRERDRDGAVVAFAGKLDSLLMPHACAAYGRGNGRYDAIHLRVPPDQPEFPPEVREETDLVRAIAANRSAPIVAPDRRDMNGAGDFSAAVVLPIYEGNTLEAFVALADKQSGEAYSEREISLLGAAAAHVSSHLLRLAQQRGRKRAYLTYAPEDRSSADEICRLLEEQGIAVWIAPRDLDPNRGHSEQIAQAIEESSVIVVVLSGSANASNAVRNEAERACSRRKAIVPFRIQNVEPSRSLELYLSSPHRLDAWKPPLRPHVEKLAETIRTLQGSAS